jgi:mannitol/fructose-specific phosphotransferase system IIA component (Ntr-type)
MKISEHLQEQAILIHSDKKSKKEILIELIEKVVSTYDLQNRDEMIEAVFAREEQMSTGIGCGLAVPHAKVGGVQNMCIAAATAENGMDFNAIDKEPVYLLILLISPQDTVGGHIRALSSVSRIMANAQVRDQLICSKSPQEFIEVLKKAEEVYS